MDREVKTDAINEADDGLVITWKDRQYWLPTAPKITARLDCIDDSFDGQA